MPPRFLAKDFLFIYAEEVPEHIEAEADLNDHDPALWCLGAKVIEPPSRA